VRTTVKPGRKNATLHPGETKRAAEEPTARRDEPVILRAAALKQVAWLAHGFSTRSGGVSTTYADGTLNLGFTKEDSKDSVVENRRRFLMALGTATEGQPWPLITVRQVHSDIVHLVTERDPGQLVGDGLITSLSGIAIAIQTADCHPVLLVDTRKRVVGVFHAGWRGTVKRIVEKGAGIMRHEFGSRPQDIRAAIGPGIQKCCYTVGEELRDEFRSQFPYGDDLFHEVHESDPLREKYPLLFLSARPPGHGPSGAKLHLDLCEANRRQLLSAGVPANRIEVLARCTGCEISTFFSHRVEKGRTGRMMLAAGIVP
jgi:YfiH family protein